VSRSSRIRVAAVDDDSAFLQWLQAGMKITAGLKWVCGFETNEQAIAALPRLHTDVLLLDIGLPGLDGIDACKKLKRRWPLLRIMILSGMDLPVKILAAFEAGADGYMLKHRTNRQQLEQAIEKVHCGGNPISPQVAEALIAFVRGRVLLLDRLSPTEKKILEVVRRGGSYKVAASNLKISINTLKSHVKRILIKTGAGNMAEAAYIRGQAIY